MGKGRPGAEGAPRAGRHGARRRHLHLRDRRAGEAGAPECRWAGGRNADRKRLRALPRRGKASGRAAGRREPLTCAAEEAELQQPMAGPGEPGGGAGRAATPRSPSACEPAGARGGRGLAPHGSAVAAAARTRRVLRRRRGSRWTPATSHGGGGGGGCAAPAPLLLLQLLSGGKGRAAAAPPPVPRLPPPAPSPSPAPSPGPPPPQRLARLPSDSPPPVQRRAGGRAAAAKTRPGPLARVGACAVPIPFSGGTEAERCLGARRAPGAEAPVG